MVTKGGTKKLTRSTKATKKYPTKNTSSPRKSSSNSTYNRNEGINYTTSTTFKNYPSNLKPNSYTYNLKQATMDETSNEPSNNTRVDYVRNKSKPRLDMEAINSRLYQKRMKRIDEWNNEENLKFINYAIKKGIGNLIKDNPEIEGAQDYLLKHIKGKEIFDRFNAVYSGALDEGIKPSEARQLAYEVIEDYISGGHLMDERAKKTLLKSGLEETLKKEDTKRKQKGAVYNILHHRQFKRNEYVNKARNAFEDLNALLQTGDYEERMPEISKSVKTLYDLNFLEPATEILKDYKLITGMKYNSLKNQMYKMAKEEKENLVGGIEQRVAAGIIGFIGVLLMLTNINITGAVIGTTSKITIGIVGMFMIFFALLWYLRPFKKVFKKKHT